MLILQYQVSFLLCARQFSLAVRVGHKRCEVFLFLPLRCLESHMRNSYIIIYNLHTHTHTPTHTHNYKLQQWRIRLGFLSRAVPVLKYYPFPKSFLCFLTITVYSTLQESSYTHAYFSLTQKKKKRMSGQVLILTLVL